MDDEDLNPSHSLATAARPNIKAGLAALRPMVGARPQRCSCRCAHPRRPGKALSGRPSHFTCGVPQHAGSLERSIHQPASPDGVQCGTLRVTAPGPDAARLSCPWAGARANLGVALARLQAWRVRALLLSIEKKARELRFAKRVKPDPLDPPPAHELLRHLLRLTCQLSQAMPSAELAHRKVGDGAHVAADK